MLTQSSAERGIFETAVEFLESLESGSRKSALVLSFVLEKVVDGSALECVSEFRMA